MTPSLENVRRLVEWSRRDCRAGSAAAIETVGILGAGMMGRAIAAAHVAHRLPVVISDADQAVLADAVDSIAADSPPPLRAQIQGTPGLIRATADTTQAARCDLVLESIVESLPAKRQLYAELQTQRARNSIVASNTSTIPIGRLAECFADASRFCGMHFLYPVRHRPLVEIVRGPRTSDDTIASAVAHVRRIGKMPIVVRDGPGFLVNRLLFPYLAEALEMLRQGVGVEVIERAAVDFGMAVGPLRLIDEIGLDTALDAGWVLAAAFPERILSSPLLVSMVKAGRLGRKTGRGFYVYNGSAAPVVDLAGVEEVAARWIDGRRNPAGESISLQLVLPMLLEATRILEEGGVDDAHSVDLAVLFGLGFPAEKGGLLCWADALGAARILNILRSLEGMGDRSRPTAMLSTLASSGGRFYPEPTSEAAAVSQTPEIPAVEASPW